MDNELRNCAKISFKKSSTSGNIGYDIDITNSDATQEQMDKIVEIALNSALKARKVLEM